MLRLLRAPAVPVHLRGITSSIRATIAVTEDAQIAASTSKPSSPVPSSSRPPSTRPRAFKSPHRPKMIKYNVPRGINAPPVTDPLLTYFTSHLLQDGKRHQAARRVADTLNIIHILTGSAPLPIFRDAIERASPEVKVVSEKRRNKNVMAPRPLGSKQRTGQAIRWILQVSDSRNDHKWEQRLAKEIIAIVKGESDVLKRKDELHRLALANRANASVRI